MRRSPADGRASPRSPVARPCTTSMRLLVVGRRGDDLPGGIEDEAVEPLLVDALRHQRCRSRASGWPTGTRRKSSNRGSAADAGTVSACECVLQIGHRDQRGRIVRVGVGKGRCSRPARRRRRPRCRVLRSRTARGRRPHVLVQRVSTACAISLPRRRAARGARRSAAARPAPRPGAARRRPPSSAARRADRRRCRR